MFLRKLTSVAVLHKGGSGLKTFSKFCACCGRINIPQHVLHTTNNGSKCNLFTFHKKALSSSLALPSAEDERTSRGSSGKVKEEVSFGNLGKDELRKYRIPEHPEVEEDDDHHIRLSSTRRKHSPAYYGRKIEKLTKKGMIFEATQVLEQEMLVEDRVMPSQYVFTTLIGGLGRVGYTAKAFHLFNKMKKMGLSPEDPTYTALFNACSNSLSREDGLLRAQKLRMLMQEKDATPNLTTYKSMIKAFGVCGDLEMAFSLVDEMLGLGYRVDGEVFKQLLIACISDREAGLKHAIEVWRRLRKKSLTPDTKHYNLLLRAIRDCGLGDAQLVRELLRRKPGVQPGVPGIQTGITRIQSGTSGDSHTQQVSGQSKGLAPKRDGGDVKEAREGATNNQQNPVNRDGLLRVIPLSDTEVNTAESEEETSKDHKYWWQYQDEQEQNLTVANQEQHVQSNEPMISVLDMEVPNILNPRGLAAEVIDLTNLSDPAARLGLFGGLAGFLSHMTRDEAQPDIKTFSQLLPVVPNTRISEEDLQAAMALHKVKPDVDFYNALIRRRIARKHNRDAIVAFDAIIKQGLQPSVLTFASLALGCYKKQTGMQLLRDMETLEVIPTSDIMGILMRRSGDDYDYKLRLIKHMMKHDIRPSKDFLVRMEKKIMGTRDLIVKKEMGEEVFPRHKTEHFYDDFNMFMKIYRSWLKNVDMEREIHPWEKFKQPHPNTVVEQQKLVEERTE